MPRYRFLPARPDAPPARRSFLLAATLSLWSDGSNATILNRASPSLPDPAGGDGLLYPAALIELPASRQRVLAVDASQSQLHLMERRGRHWTRALSYPVAVGRKGLGKTVEGDQRTPLGIYEIVGRHPDHKLPRIYGPGALVLDYPNDLDRREGRTGSNIWIHGMPPERSSAPTRSSSGCLVLANAHIQHLLDLLDEEERILILIARQLEWVHPSSGDPEGRMLRRRLQAWRDARAEADADQTWSFYARHFANAQESADLWRRGIERELATTGPQAREIRDLAILAWDNAVRQVSFTEVLAGMRRGLQRRQYWALDEGEWRIFSEGVYE